MNARQMAQALGRRGGRARARRLTATQRRRIASLGGQARSTSLKAAQRIAANLRYAATLDELRGGRIRVERIRTFGGPLPGIYVPGR